MRKITGLCIIVALLVSIFDIIDVNDITLNGKEIFTTDNACAQHNDDDLNDSGYHAFSLNLQIFNLPQTASCTFFAEAPEHPLPCFDIPASLSLILTYAVPRLLKRHSNQTNTFLTTGEHHG